MRDLVGLGEHVDEERLADTSEVQERVALELYLGVALSRDFADQHLQGGQLEVPRDRFPGHNVLGVGFFGSDGLRASSFGSRLSLWIALLGDVLSPGVLFWLGFSRLTFIWVFVYHPPITLFVVPPFFLFRVFGVFGVLGLPFAFGLFLDAAWRSVQGFCVGHELFEPLKTPDFFFELL